MKRLSNNKYLSIFPSVSFPRAISNLRDCANLGAEFPCIGIQFSLAIIGGLFFASDAFAMKEDGMKAGLTTLEAVLTGNFTRLIVICGSIWGAYQAYSKSSPMLLGGSVAIGLGFNFLMSWANTTWAITV